MVRFVQSVVVVVAVLSAMVCSAGAAEMVANPAYASWASHKPGTKIVFEQQISASGMNMTHEVAQTLKEVTPDKVVLGTSVVMNMGGMKRETQQTVDIAAKVEQGKENLPPNAKGSMKETGTETLTIGGKSYECKVYEFSGESEQGPATGKVWRTAALPGGMAKMSMQMQGQMQATMTMTVTSIEEK